MKFTGSFSKILICVLFGFFLIPFTMTGQESNTPKMEFQPTLQHVTLVVSNFEKSKKFYLEDLGLTQKPTDFLPKNQMFVFAGGNLELHIGEVPNIKIQPNSFNHFALAVNDFDGYLNYLKQKGIVYTSLGGGKPYAINKRPDGIKQTFIQDPDDYWVEINSTK